MRPTIRGRCRPIQGLVPWLAEPRAGCLGVCANRRVSASCCSRCLGCFPAHPAHVGCPPAAHASPHAARRHPGPGAGLVHSGVLCCKPVRPGACWRDLGRGETLPTAAATCCPLAARRRCHQSCQARQGAPALNSTATPSGAGLATLVSNLHGCPPAAPRFGLTASTPAREHSPSSLPRQHYHSM